jgi:hypothetical protein
MNEEKAYLKDEQLVKQRKLWPQLKTINELIS